MQINHPTEHNYEARLYGIGSGSSGIRDTTRLMAKLASHYANDPNIRAQAISIVQLNQPKDHPAEIRALFDFVKHWIRYVGDVTGKETVQTPDKTLLLRAGDCDDKSLLLATLLLTIGYEPFFVVTGYTAPGVYEHVYVGVNDPDHPGESIALDTTEPAPMGWEADNPVTGYVEPIA